MSRARDNIHSNRSREDIDRDQEAQQKAADIRLTLLYTADPVKYRAAMEEMFRLGMDVKVGERTRAGMLDSYTRRTLDLVQPTPGVTINQGLQITAADLLRLIPVEGGAGTTGCMSGLPTTSDTIGLPNPTPPDECRSPRAGVTDDRDATDGPPERVRSAPDAEPPLPAPVSREPVRAAGDATRCPACHARTDEEQHECPVPEEDR